MPSCLVKGCHFGDGGKGKKGVMKHKLPPPSSAWLREKWLSQINREMTRSIQEHDFVCSDHFKTESYLTPEENRDTQGRPRSKPCLRPLAFPTENLRPADESTSRPKIKAKRKSKLAKKEGNLPAVPSTSTVNETPDFVVEDEMFDSPKKMKFDNIYIEARA